MLSVLESQQSFLMHPIKLPGDMGHVKFCFGPFGVGVSVSAR
jgi:hypothetical protein